MGLTMEDQRVQKNLREMLERNLRMRGLGAEHIERVMRLNPVIRDDGRVLRGLRITLPGRYRMMDDRVSKGEVIRAHGRDAWGALERMHAISPIITKRGRHKWVGYEVVKSLQRTGAIGHG